MADPFKSVALDCQLEMVSKLLRVHGLSRGLELGNHIIDLDEVNDSSGIRCRDEHEGRRESRGKMMKNGR